MNKVRQEEEDNGVSSEGTRIGVCVGKERNRGLGALKWAIEKEIIPPQGHVYLLHVVSPLRWIPDPKGRGKLSINNLSTEMAQLFREQHFVEARKMFDDYTTLCERNKFTYQLCSLENDLIHEELVSQIFNLRITILLLEKSSQMFLGRARGSESISSNVIKSAPDFCKVLIIRNNKLYSMNEDSGLFSDPSTSPTMKSNMGVPIKTKTTAERSIIAENIIKEINDVDLQRFSEQRTTLHRTTFPRASMDHSAVSYDDQSPKMIRTKSAMQFTERSASHGLLHYEYDESNLLQKNFKEKYAYEGLQTEGLAVNSNTEQSCHPHVFLEDVTFAPSSSGGNDNSIRITDIPGSLPSQDSIITSKHSAETENLTQSNTPEVMSSSESLHEMDRGGTETGDLTESGMHEAISSCNLWHEMNNVMDVNSEVHKDEASLALDFDHLQYQLIEAKQSSLKWAQFEAATRENNYKMLEGILRNTKKKIAEAWMQKEDALNEARIASDKACMYQMKLEELTAATQSSFQNQKILQEQLNDERTLRLMMEDELKETRRLLESIIRNAKTLELKCQEEGKRCEKINSELEKEVQLRKMAEERASKEAEEAVLARKREHNMYLEYTFEELQLATDNFSEKNMLGRGSYGPVYKGKLHYTTVAIKLLADEGRRGRAEFQKEVCSK
ncbi:hypothetical protein KP509_15G026000 [Ceratopteris richardii]|uniref:RING-type E3 ubiquitin transferase n=1 Tax=Ceratopteris richardii TaxID=49495 RepID=A0A8T2T3M1_CERRI|nr:hypothetical protein KP509_15G026000 [Ceratopteris richardii]